MSSLRASLLVLLLAGCATKPPAPPAAEPVLLSALDPGQSQSSVTGCLAGEKDKSVVRRTADYQDDDLEVRTVAGGALVIHHLTHPCCLQANVRLITRGNVATVHERLGGEPVPLRLPLDHRDGDWPGRRHVDRPGRGRAAVRDGAPRGRAAREDPRAEDRGDEVTPVVTPVLT